MTRILFVLVLGAAAWLNATELQIPALNWQPRSDWTNVQTAVTPGAKGDGVADDTAAIQKATDATRAHGHGALAYLPTGIYVVTQPLRITGADYRLGGSGFRSGLFWRGAAGGSLIEVVDPQRVTIENLNVGSHDVAVDMTNACDILQTGTASASSITYDNVTVFGMYDRQPFRKGLWLRGLGKGATVRVTHVEGNIHLVDAARATVLLGTSCTHGLYVKDNHSLVASDFYIEPTAMRFQQSGAGPLEVVFWADSFYNSHLTVQKTAAAQVSMAGCAGVSDKLEGVEVDDTPSAGLLAGLATPSMTCAPSARSICASTTRT